MMNETLQIWGSLIGGWALIGLVICVFDIPEPDACCRMQNLDLSWEDYIKAVLGGPIVWLIFVLDVTHNKKKNCRKGGRKS